VPDEQIIEQDGFTIVPEFLAYEGSYETQTKLDTITTFGVTITVERRDTSVSYDKYRKQRQENGGHNTHEDSVANAIIMQNWVIDSMWIEEYAIAQNTVITTVDTLQLLVNKMNAYGNIYNARVTYYFNNAAVPLNVFGLRIHVPYTSLTATEDTVRIDTLVIPMKRIEKHKIGPWIGD